MSAEKSAFRQIFKTTSVFGGVQIIQIIVGIIRSKFIAMLLGPGGMGVSGLLQATTGMISSLTAFGLSTSAVRNISEAFGSGNQEKINRVSSIFSRLVWFTGLLGLLITLILAPLWSKLTFGHNRYSWAFMALSVTLLINQLSASHTVLLRGMRQVSALAQASLYGSIIGLAVTIPLYYQYRENGIVPAMVIASVVTLLLTQFYRNKLAVSTTPIPWKEAYSEGKEMLVIGFLLSINSMLTMGVSYAVRVFVGHEGGLSTVGFYNAGFAILNTYVGMVFMAMSSDYYPKLSSVITDIDARNQAVNQQTEVAFLILAPALLGFVVFIKFVVVILYSTAFLPMAEMLLYAAPGIVFKAASWSMAYMFLASGNKRLFFWNEVAANGYVLVFGLVFYKLYGLNGLGISYLLTYLVYFIQVWILTRHFYQLIYSKKLQVFMLAILLLLALVFFISKQFGEVYSLWVGGIVVLLTGIYSIKVVLSNFKGVLKRKAKV